MFAPGDRVRIKVHDWDANKYNGDPVYEYGRTGIIIEVAPRKGSPDIMNYVVQMDVGAEYGPGWLYLDAIELIAPGQTMNPDVSLDEIHQFRELVERS